MSRFLILLLIMAGVAVAQAQDNTSDAASDDVSAATDVDSNASEADEALEDSDLDSQAYEEDEDDFVPTEEIPADEPIPFPSNI